MLEKYKSEKLDVLSTETGTRPAELVDVDWLVAQPLLPFLMQALPPQLLYRSLVNHGFEDSLEVIEWLRGNQLQKVLDYDLWEKPIGGSVEDVSGNSFLNWITLWSEISDEFAAERFFELEEETLTLTLTKILEIIPLGLSRTADDACQDTGEDAWQTPDKKFFLRLRKPYEHALHTIKNFIDSLYANSIAYAGSVLSYAAMLVREESLEMGLRRRAGRLCDQGFVDAHEARDILSLKKFGDFKKIIAEQKELEKKRQLARQKLASVDAAHNAKHQQHNPEVFDNIVQMFSQFTAEEGVQHMQLALSAETLKQIAGSQNTAVEYFYDDDEFVNTVAEEIVEKCNGLLLKREVRNAKLNTGHLLIDKVFAFLAEHEQESLLFLKERLAFISNVLASGTTGFVGDDALGRLVSVVKGALNIGLEMCFAAPSEYELNLEFTTDNVQKGCVCVQSLGVEFLFQLGWNAIGTLAAPKEKTGVVIPMYPKMLDDMLQNKTHVTQSVRPFETLSDIENVKKNGKNLLSFL